MLAVVTVKMPVVTRGIRLQEDTRLVLDARPRSWAEMMMILLLNSSYTLRQAELRVHGSIPRITDPPGTEPCFVLLRSRTLDSKPRRQCQSLDVWAVRTLINPSVMHSKPRLSRAHCCVVNNHCSLHNMLHNLYERYPYKPDLLTH